MFLQHTQKIEKALFPAPTFIVGPFYYATIFVIATIHDIVTMENMVDNDTIFTDSSVSLSNFAANIVVAAADGALTAIATVISMFPLSPIK